MSHEVARLVRGDAFQRLVVAAIIANAALLGLETSDAVMAQWGGVLRLVHWALTALFLAELLLRLAASAPRLTDFFRDRWNVFDTVVILGSLLPQAGPLALVARLARLLRLARMFSVVPELRLLVGTMLRSLGSLGHVLMLLSVVLYGYALVGVYLFRAVDPEHWGSLGLALLTLFEVVTLEGWADLQAAVIGRVPLAWAYFASFIVLAVFVVINLFIAVVVNNLEATKAAERRASRPRPPHRIRLSQRRVRAAAFRLPARQ